MTRFSYGTLKKGRVVVSLVCFSACALLFLDARHLIPPAAGDVIASLQVIPALVQFLAAGIGAAGISLAGLAVVVVLTVLFGRVYCSTLCPLGTLQDVVIRLGKKMNRRKRFRYGRTQFTFHYGVLFLSGGLAVAGGMTLLNLLEPFSSFGRIVANLIEPLVIFANNGLEKVLVKAGLPFLYAIPLRAVAAGALIIPGLFLGLVVYLSYSRGRYFCNSLCPAGAILSLLSRISLVRIAINTGACDGCGACERVCKAGCIESGSHTVDFAACVGCFNCLKSCPTDAVVFRPVWKKHHPESAIPAMSGGRRKLLKETLPKAALLAATDLLPGAELMTIDSAYRASRRHPITPPGSAGVAHFTGLCTACHRCVTACPSQVLSPTFLDYGLAGMFQPRLDFDAGYCAYDCTVCGQVCPTGAILPLAVDVKKRTQVGRAMFVRADCVVVTINKDCGACAEHCPTKAVRMVPYDGRIKIPELTNDICIGCGACEHACPTIPRKAIYVNPNSVHVTANAPSATKVEQGFDSSQEFPF